MNLNHNFPSIIWDTACLIIDSGSYAEDENEEDEITDDEELDEEKETETKSKQTDYGKIAKAIATMRYNGREVALPNINTSNFGFKPDIENDYILFGLRGIAGIGDAVAKEIMDNRPYQSLDDFFVRLVDIKNSIVKTSHVITLIKGGAFDSLENKTRVQVMKDFLTKLSKPKKSLNMQNMPSLERMELIPKEYSEEYKAYYFRKKVFSLKAHNTILNSNPNIKKKVDDIHYKIVGDFREYYLEKFEYGDIIEYDEEFLIVSKNSIDKRYNEIITPLKDFIANDKELLEKYNLEMVRELWREKAMGSVSSWEMQSLCFYHSDHELKHINEKKYGISKLRDLSKEPTVVGVNNYKGKEFNKYAINRIACTVLDKNATKNSITVLTHDNEVITVQFFRGTFAHYNKQVKGINDKGKNYIKEDGWFKRGSKLLIAGYRDEDIFRPKVYSDTVYNHTVEFVDRIYEDGNISVRMERSY